MTYSESNWDSQISCFLIQDAGWAGGQHPMGRAYNRRFGPLSDLMHRNSRAAQGHDPCQMAQGRTAFPASAAATVSASFLGRKGFFKKVRSLPLNLRFWFGSRYPEIAMI